MHDIRPFLYPLGLLSSLAFSSRVLVQWLGSELQGKSQVTRTFWHLSLVGNVLLLLHSIIQAQVHVALIQAANFVVAWRNLDLMKPSPRMSFSGTLQLVAVMLLSTAALTAGTSYALTGAVDWIRIPLLPWHNPLAAQTVPFTLHLIGAIGLLLFNSRFWVQWWIAERSGRSELPPIFWWLSLIGGVTSLFYFGTISDPINLLGPLFGVAAYSRNLMLLYRTS